MSTSDEVRITRTFTAGALVGLLALLATIAHCGYRNAEIERACLEAGNAPHECERLGFGR